ncbi:hypothetical protein [Coralloluteibacterium thermophilus]|uniref:Alpha/beta hydrolase n=1 Tax=Coralloluteibacterium thermophilum TaxID=2707049 RepID=A0ABV9NMM4_9GAMM
MKGHVILSHGLESSPNATKVSALAAVAERLGWSHERPDYSDIDAGRRVADIDLRIARLRERAEAACGKGPVVLAGSSMGAFVSGFVSQELPTAGLFLMAPPIAIDGFPRRFDAARVPTRIVHGWDDELIPAQAVIDWAYPRRDGLVLVADSHRLAAHVEFCAEEFGRFLQGL